MFFQIERLSVLRINNTNPISLFIVGDIEPKKTAYRPERWKVEAVDRFPSLGCADQAVVAALVWALREDVVEAGRETYVIAPVKITFRSRI